MKLKSTFDERLIERYASSKTSNFVESMRKGWNAYNFIFYIGSIAAILGILTGWLGVFYIIITMLFFYYAGKFKEKVDAAKKSNELRDRKRAR